jgi:DNA repair protein RadC
VFKHFRIRLRDLKQEQFIVVLLDNKKRYLNDLVITQGTLNTSPVHPREVFNAAIRERAASVVVVHNHPSGDPNPSREDIHVTQQLIKVGELVGIPVLDHVIIADDLYLSMLEQGLLKS